MAALMKCLANPIVPALLRSPLHGLLSRDLMLISMIGRRTGRRQTLPVQYARRGDEVYVLSWPDRRWWRSLAGFTCHAAATPALGVVSLLRRSPL
jgi:hypothetical protein